MEDTAVPFLAQSIAVGKRHCRVLYIIPAQQELISTAESDLIRYNYPSNDPKKILCLADESGDSLPFTEPVRVRV